MHIMSDEEVSAHSIAQLAAASRRIPACSGDSCQGGRFPCATPDACQLPDWEVMPPGEALKTWAGLLAPVLCVIAGMVLYHLYLVFFPKG